MPMTNCVNAFGGGTYYDGQIYADLMRQRGPFSDDTDWPRKPLAPLRADGYPEQVGGTFARPYALAAEFSPLPAGAWTIRANGKGKFAVTLAGDYGGYVPFTFTGSNPVQAYTTTAPKPAAKSLRVALLEIDQSDPLRDIQIIVPGGAASGTPFRHVFLDDLAPFSAVRFMDWQGTNDISARTWQAYLDKQALGTNNKRGVPLADIATLSNKARTHLWVCIPWGADDDYIANMATHLDGLVDPDLTFYVEFCNEIWNWAFPMAHEVEKIRLAMPTPRPSHRTVQGQLAAPRLAKFKAALSPSRTCVRVLAGQAADAWGWNEQVAGAGGPSAFDAISCAPYFGAMDGIPAATMTTIKAQWAAGDQQGAATALAAAMAATIPRVTTNAAAVKGVADKHGKPLIAYEGGQHAVGKDATEQAIAIAANRTEAMGEAYKVYRSAAEAAGFTAFWWYFLAGRPTSFGSWGLKEYPGQDSAEAPKYRAVVGAGVEPSDPVDPGPVVDPTVGARPWLFRWADGAFSITPGD